jgi:hypothetical protein
MNIIIFFVGVLCGFIFYNLLDIFKNNKKKEPPKPIIKVLLEKELTDRSGNEIRIEYECKVLEESSDKSKIKLEVLDYNSSDSRYSKGSKNDKDIISFVDKKWIDSSDVIWLTDTKKLQRSERINDILN